MPRGVKADAKKSMAKKVIAAIDAGKFNTKAISAKGKKLFRTKYSFEHSDPDTLTEGNFNVTYKDMDYTVGSQGAYSDKNEGKDSTLHIMVTLIALSQLTDEGDEIVLMYGESFNKYANHHHKRNLEEIYLGEHHITIDGKEYTLNIVEVHVLPEGVGYILSDIQNYLGIQYTVDWGGTTVNFLKTVNGAPDRDFSTSFKLGMHNMASNISKTLAKRIGDYEEDLIQDWIETKAPTEDIQKVIDRAIAEQLLKIENKLAPMGINLYELPQVTFVGGTSEKFREMILKKYKGSTVHRDCLFSTAQGMYDFGRIKYLG